MNSKAKLTVVETPAAAAQSQYQTRKAQIAAERTEIQQFVDKATREQNEARRPGQELSHLQNRLADSIAARLSGGKPEDETELHAQIDAATVAVAAAAPILTGTQRAIDQLSAKLAELHRAEAELQATHFDVARAILDERIEAQAAVAEAALQPFLHAWAATLALCSVRDHVKAPNDTERGFNLRAQFTFPGPEASPAWEHFARKRDLGPHIRPQVDALLRELEVDPKRVA